MRSHAAFSLTLAAWLAFQPAAVWADSFEKPTTKDVPEKFQRAFFLQEHGGDLAAAEKIFGELASDASQPEALRREAKQRRDECREELASSDFARLMPPNAWAYAELSRPGEQALKLISQLGLARGESAATEKVANRIAISPELVRTLLGVRGIAACVTGVDPAQQRPTGVAIIHPGQLGVIRAALETALPIQFTPDRSIEDCETFNIENELFVTLTTRLIIVSQQRNEIEGVIRRLRGEEDESLATNATLKTALAGRESAMLFAIANFEPILPLAQAALVAATAAEPQMALAAALLDLKSLNTVVVKLGVNDLGLYADLSLDLDVGHRNLAFNFLRLPPIDQATLKTVPAGAAACVAAALGERGGARPIFGDSPSQTRAAISALDLGRELFANIIGFAAFALPTAAQSGKAAPPIPDAALVMTVKDPQKSLALWTQLLGIASMASAAGTTLDGVAADIDGVAVRRFALPDGFSILLGGLGDTIILSPSQTAISRAIATQRGGASILDDAAVAPAVSRLGKDTAIALIAHAGRCVELARRFEDGRDAEELKLAASLLTKTVATFGLDSSDHSLRVGLQVSGIPDVSGLVTQLVRENHSHSRRRTRLVESLSPPESRSGLRTANDEVLFEARDAAEAQR